MPESVNVEPTKKENINCPSCQSEVAYVYDESDLKKEKDESRSRPVYVCQKDDCRQAWQRFDLTEREIEFISKARWLLNHRKEYNDDTFWDIVESYVLKTNG